MTSIHHLDAPMRPEEWDLTQEKKPEPLKLSALIRAGAALHPHYIGDYYQNDNDGNVLLTCALGAGMIGYRHLIQGEQAPFTANYEPFREMFRYVRIDPFAHVIHPITQNKTYLRYCIVDLSDIYEWTREQIANWLESIGY